MYAFVVGATGVGARSSAFAAGTCVRAATRAVAARRATRTATTPMRMADVKWDGKVPPTEVLGLGKNVPGSVFLLLSVLMFYVGCDSVYRSNLISPLTPADIKPLYIVGSLALPMSWGCHVAAWIKFKNQK